MLKEAAEVQNILITGANGQLGSEFRYLAGSGKNYELGIKGIPKFNFIFVAREELDINNSKKVEHFCKHNEVTVMVNCAAYTAVDNAENEPNQANEVNHLAVENLAEIAKAHNIKLIHISTDYVFNGKNHKPYKETDSTNPESVYGKSKLAGENAMQAVNPANSVIIRASWIYSSFGQNFVKTMLRLGKERKEVSVVSDQVGTPTNARDLAKAVISIIPMLDNINVEVYHYGNTGVCSWYDFAEAIFEINNIDCKVNPITTEGYPTLAKRPYYSVMDKRKLIEKFKLDLEHWRKGLM